MADVLAPSRVVCLTNVVKANELITDHDCNGILHDLTEVGNRYGKLVKVFFPRPIRHGVDPPGVGRVFFEYADTTSSSVAREQLNGLSFAGGNIVANFYSEVHYDNKNYGA